MRKTEKESFMWLKSEMWISMSAGNNTRVPAGFQSASCSTGWRLNQICAGKGSSNLSCKHLSSCKRRKSNTFYFSLKNSSQEENWKEKLGMIISREDFEFHTELRAELCGKTCGKQSVWCVLCLEGIDLSY